MAGFISPTLTEWIARLGRDRFRLLIALVAGLGTAHILVRTATYGAAVSADSINYLSTAINFLGGEGWRDFTGTPLTLWPPLFPLLLAVSGWVGIDPLAAGRFINATAFGLTILVAGGWLRSHLRSRLLVLAATATIAASLPLTLFASRFATDPLFVLFTLLALLHLASFLHRRPAASLWWAAGFTALAALTRYAGVVLIGTGVLLLLPRARLKQTLGFGAISSLPLLAVLGLNWAVSGDLTQATGDRTDPSGQSLSAGLSQTVDVFGEWVVPPNAPDGLAYLLWLAVGLVGLAGAAVVLYTTRMRSDDSRYDQEAGPQSCWLGPAVPFGVFALIYLVFMVAIVPFTVRQGIDSRYLLPVYVPLLLMAVLLLDRFLSIEAAGRMVAIRHGLASLVLLGAFAHIGFSAHSNLIITARIGYIDWTYSASYWQHSETLNYIRDNPINGRIYSNNAFLAWFGNRTATPGKYRLAEGREIVAGKSPFSRLAQERMRWTEEGTSAHIVWFREFHKRRPVGYSVMDIRVLPGVEVVAELSDGVVFRVAAAPPAAPFDEAGQRTRKQRYVRQLIQQAQASEPVVCADWDVYRTGRTLTYLKQPCAPADVQAKFVLHLIPVDPAALPPHRQRYGFDNFDFYFDQVGVRLADQCIATAHLPAYPIGRIRVGQWISGDNRTVWDAEFAESQ